MLTISPNQKILVYTQPIDMRKAVNGLVSLLVEQFGQNPQSGDVYLFVNRDRKKVKCLIWDKNGFVLYYKRLERGRFNYSPYLQGEAIEVSERQLRALLMGLDFHVLSDYSEADYDDFF